jgi:ADP-ribose pyrophosphatase YjhB (NUDIX family)
MTENLDVTASLARWSQSLAGIAQTGLAFAESPYDAERYEELLRLAAEMTASVNASAHLDATLAAQLESEWRRQVETGFQGYATPKVSVGAIVFNARDEMLLVQKAADQTWCFPVGMADVGYTPAEVARKEALEEAGLHVTPIRLMGVADSLRRGLNQSVHVYNLHFYCRLDGGKLGPQTVEISEAAFFGRDKLPEPLLGLGKYWVDHAFDWHSGTIDEPYFD